MMRYQRSVLLAAMAILSACQSAYVPPPANTQTARLRVLQIGGDNTDVQKLKTACLTTEKNARNFGDYFEKIANFSGVSSASDLQRLGMPDPPAAPVKFTEIAIDATRPFLLGYNSMRFVSGYPQSVTYTCVMGLSFVPQPSEDYEAVISRASDTQCRFEIQRLTVGKGTAAREKVDSARLLREACL